MTRSIMLSILIFSNHKVTSRGQIISMKSCDGLYTNYVVVWVMQIWCVITLIVFALLSTPLNDTLKVIQTVYQLYSTQVISRGSSNQWRSDDGLNTYEARFGELFKLICRYFWVFVFHFPPPPFPLGGPVYSIDQI
jgi:hypothetical protein